MHIPCRLTAGSDKLPRMKTVADPRLLYLTAARAGELLCAGDQRLATAESCTGGWIAQAMTAVPGSSRWYEGGVVTYSNALKRLMLQVPSEYLEGADAPGAVSEPTVTAMAEGARQLMTCDWAIASSGIAGPGGGSEKKPVGMVWLAWAGPRGCDSEVFYFAGDRERIRYLAVEAALEGLLVRLDGSHLGAVRQE